MADIIKALPSGLIVATMAIAAVLALLVPIVLRLAGLSGQQIVDVMTMTTKFFLEIVREFRNENKNPP